jgi:hypothetical protein
MFPVTIGEARDLNKNGYGVFHTVQLFKSNKRTSDNLENIVAYAFDMDDFTKQEQLSKIIEVGVEPSRVIESKRGFHVYFFLDGYGNPKYYKSFLEEYIIPTYNACCGAKDIARVLRTPNFYHQKDPNDKFLVKQIYDSNIKYREDKLFKIFLNKVKKKLPEKKNSIKPHINTNKKTAYEIIRAIGGKQTKMPNGAKFHCIAHLVKTQSLAIQQDNEKVLVHCYAGCPQEKVIQKLREMDLW